MARKPGWTLSRAGVGYGLNLTMMTLLFVGFILVGGLELTDSSIVKSGFRLLTALCALATLILYRTLPTLLLAAAFVATFMMVLNQNPMGLNIIFTVLMVGSLTKIDRADVSRIFLLASLAGIALHLITLALGLVSVEYTDFGGRQRTALGFRNANLLATCYLTLAASSLFYHTEHRSRLSFWTMLGCFGLSLQMAIFSDSRTNLFSIALLIGLLLFGRFSAPFAVPRVLFRLGLSSLAILAPLATYIFSTNPSPLLNILLSARPAFFELAVQDAPLHGLLIGWKISEHITIDNAYLLMVATFGLPLTLVCIGWIASRLWHLQREYLPVAAITLLASIFESFLLRPELPLSVLFFFMLLQPALRSASYHTARPASGRSSPYRPPFGARAQTAGLEPL